MSNGAAAPASEDRFAVDVQTRELAVIHERGRRYQLTQLGPHRFIMKADNRMMTFVLDAKGNVTQVDVTYPGDSNTYVLPRVR